MSFVLAILSIFGLFVPHAPVAQAQQEIVRADRTRVAAVVAVPTPEPKPAVEKTATVRTAAVPAPATSAATPKPAVVVSKTTAAPAPAPDFARAVENEIFKLVNTERAKAGLGALVADSKLAGIARAHSADMLNKDYFSHVDKKGCDSSCRVTNAGYAWTAVGENLYTITGYNMSASETARMLVSGWMKSAPHRANILNGTFTNHGIGVAVSGSTVYATSVFALPR